MMTSVQAVRSRKSGESPITLRSRVLALSAVLTLVVGVEPMLAQGAPKSTTPSSIAAPVSVTEVASGLVHPWGLAALPDGRMLVTERPGRLRFVSKDGQLSTPIQGVPAVYAEGQGGLLDVTIDPAFAQNKLIYLSYSEISDSLAGTAVARGKLENQSLTDVRVIYRQHPKVKGAGHFGSRIVFRRDGTLFITQGERMSYSEQAQDLASGLGKIVRIKSDGTIPKDNPFLNRKGVRPEIWSYGHRNVQAAALDPATGDLWEIEHGPKGGDELNRAQAARNYGWPIITYGVNYSGTKVGEGITAKAGMEQPTFYWNPVIAPSGMIFYTGNVYPQWKGSIFVGSLAPGALVRLTMRNGRVTQEERYLGELNERIREVAQGSDGKIYLLTDSKNGRILRLDPLKK